jgi:hypothetical protein
VSALDGETFTRISNHRQPGHRLRIFPYSTYQRLANRIAFYSTLQFARFTAHAFIPISPNFLHDWLLPNIMHKYSQIERPLIKACSFILNQEPFLFQF